MSHNYKKQCNIREKKVKIYSNSDKNLLFPFAFSNATTELFNGATIKLFKKCFLWDEFSVSGILRVSEMNEDGREHCEKLINDLTSGSCCFFPNGILLFNTSSLLVP